MKLNFNFSGKTLLKDWWKTVRDNFTTIQTDHNTLSDKLDTEITQRTNADVGLSDQITAEKKARESADSSLSSRINNEVTIRQAADNELQRNIDSEITERQTADSKKADKTELYGTDETTKHTITHTLTTSDFVITTDSYDRGTVKIPAETVHSKILLDGSPMPATEVIGTFDCGKSEEDHGDKYVAIAYSPNTGKLDIDVVDISDRMDGHDSLSDRINTETGERQAADMQLSARINSIGNKAPLNHASTGTTYGVGDATNYGHLKLSDSVSSSNSTSNGCAATPKATKTAYDKAVEAYELADGKLDANFVSNGYAGIDEVTTTLSDMWSDRVAPPTTITISSSTSKHMLTADYYCSGTNDQTVINNAISALPSTGGKIVLLEGTYNISGQINVNKPNVTICGMGNSTVLNCKQGIWGIAATQTNFTVANLKMTFDTYNGNGNSICIYASGSSCKFENLDLSNAVYGINCGGGYSIIHNVTATDNNINIHLGSAYNIVSDCYSEDAKETGIRVEGICNIVTGCHISDAGTYGILVTSGGGSKVADNIIIRDSYSDSQYSIYVTSSAYNSCTDNVMIGKNYTNVGGTTNSFISNKYS